ncbi:transglutaminase domain-containing protein [Flavobacterium sp. 7A]|uniref:transglutaminase domain-containing protein n=1 Tax=Flavobacterium sp. 7A TaxID=2940571 RepID=UPI002227257E|nr:transglutaminase domain-containing protein [Flavobacterium sp. 7A]MCW2118107.1 transglutaminase/protease-like cytokinesis protein 3 [Flavobacterium sp. 7A]
MKLQLMVLCFLVSFGVFCQINPKYDSVDKKMAVIPADFITTTAKIATYINANFKTDEDKLRAVFYWTATNISYDVKNMLVDNSLETSQEKINNTLKSHQGVCIHYAEVFHAITTDLKIKNFIIDGMVKQGDKVNTLAHAWCAVEMDGKWFLADPTWGAGGIQNGIFVKKLNNSYYKVAPSLMVESHLPFDYLWQFSASPITFDTFISNKITKTAAKVKFDFEQEIIRYQTLSEMDRFFEVVQRIENNGYKLPVVTAYLTVIKKNASAARLNSGVDKMNRLVTNYNQAIVYLNDLVVYRNKKFNPIISDEDLVLKARESKEKLTKCQEDVYAIGDVGAENKVALSTLKRQINDALHNSEEQYQFVQDYLKHSKIGRKMMFGKLSLFGVGAH